MDLNITNDNKNFNIRKRIALHACAFIIPFIMMQVFWAICGVYPFGSKSILTGDMDLEFVNFYSYFINIFKSKNDFSYMLAKTLGGDYPGLAAFQLHDPLLFVLFLFPGEKIAAGIELVFSLQISIAGLSASILLNRRYQESWMSLLFSTAYAFSAFFFGYLVLTIYFGCLAILPLVIYFFLKYLDDDKYLIPYTLCTVYYIFVNFHMGFMLVIFLVLLYVSRIIEDTSKIKKFKDFIISGTAILLIDGFFLIRTGLSLLGEKTTQTADYGFYRRFPMNQLFASLFSGCSRSDLRPLIYCSFAAVFCALIYFLSRRFSLREKLANLFLIASIAVSMWINILDAVWHGFNNPEGFNWRYAYYLSLILIVLGYKGFISVTDGPVVNDEESKPSMKKLVILPAMSFLIITLYMVWLKISGNIYMDTERCIVNILLLITVSVTIIMCAMKGKPGMVGFILLTVISFSDMLYSSRLSYLSLNEPDQGLPEMSRFMTDYNDIDSAVSFIKSNDKGFYRIEKDFDRAVNDPAMFDYIGLSHDSSCEKDEVIDWLLNFGFCRTVYYTYYNEGNTSFVDSLFGVKYFVSRFDGINKPYTHLPYKGKYHVYENDLALPMVYVAPAGLTDHLIENGNIFDKQNAIAGYWSIGKDIFVKADVEVILDGVSETEPGHYIKEADDGALIYRIQVTSDQPLYMFFSAPEYQGAEIYVNEDSMGPYFTEMHWGVLCAGRHKPGDVVQIRMQLNGDELYINDAGIVYEDTDALKEWADKAAGLNRGISDVNEISSSHLYFETNESDDSELIMSIPYDKCWTIKIDGRKAVTKKAMGMIMGIEVPGGNHSIEMKYVPRGTFIGIIVSLAGIILLIIEVIKTRRH
ncbi:MAG: YfhO family protein [Lachnospiraceae bacterium]|nr:YfhO family protein [Lachnospiraceae bacterium]